MILKDLPRGLPHDEGRDKDEIPQALWADPKEIIQSAMMKWDASKVLLGTIDNHVIGLKDDRHICTIAGSRAGKGVWGIYLVFLHSNLNIPFYECYAISLSDQDANKYKR